MPINNGAQPKPVDAVYFDVLKESRTEYFVKYSPPSPGYRFATIAVTFTAEATPESAVQAIGTETNYWLGRFPIPVMVTAFDLDGELMNLKDVRPESHLMAFHDSDGNVEQHWRLLANDEIPDNALDTAYLLDTYTEVPYRTSSDLEKGASTYLRQLRRGWYVVFAWAVVVPAIVAIAGFLSPLWLSALVLAYSLFKAFAKAMKLLGKWKKSPQEVKEEEDHRRARHHHYHCEQNPEGFMRLKLENFERWEREEIQREAEEIRSSDND